MLEQHITTLKRQLLAATQERDKAKQSISDLRVQVRSGRGGRWETPLPDTHDEDTPSPCSLMLCDRASHASMHAYRSHRVLRVHMHALSFALARACR